MLLSIKHNTSHVMWINILTKVDNMKGKKKNEIIKMYTCMLQSATIDQ